MTEETIQIPKKRGRKKKIISPEESDIHPIPNKKKSTAVKIKLIDRANHIQLAIQEPYPTILYLKCSLKSVDNYILNNNKDKYQYQCNYDPTIPSEIQPFQDASIPYELYKNSTTTNNNNETSLNNTSTCVNKNDTDIISSRLKTLKISMYTGANNTKKSACFWCTYPFDSDTCYILQKATNGTYIGHGSFCSPECSVAYLFNRMGWDDSRRFESYQLINYFYGKDSNYSINIKPANNPYYFLEKFYGNFTIQEFRELSKSNHMLLCIDKPISRVLPEIHEDSELIGINSTPSVHNKGNYKVKRHSEKQNTVNRNDVLRNNFGVSANV